MTGVLIRRPCKHTHREEGHVMTETDLLLSCHKPRTAGNHHEVEEPGKNSS